MDSSLPTTTCCFLLSHGCRGPQGTAVSVACGSAAEQLAQLPSQSAGPREPGPTLSPEVPTPLPPTTKSHLFALPQLYQDTEHFPILTGALKMLGWLAQARMLQPCLSSHLLHTHLPCHWLQSSRIFAASLCRVRFMSAPKGLKISANVSLAPKTLLRPHASSTALFFKVFHFFYPGDQMYLL